MTGKKLLQTHCGDWFLPEAFMSCFKNSKGKKNSFDKATLKSAGRRIRYDRTWRSELNEAA